MGYIGNTPAEKYITLSKQTFTPDSSTVAFTLDNPVANENELAVFVNNVRQEPGSGKAYTATGTTLTMSEAPTSGHAMYAIYLGKTMATNTPADGSVTGAMMSYPLTGFESTGIDDNATSTAITIDSSGNLLVGKTSSNGSIAGAELRANGRVFGTADDTVPLFLNRLTSEGDIVTLRKDGNEIGLLGVDFTDNLYISGNSTHAGLNFGTASVVPYKNGDNIDATIDWGSSATRFKDLYLSGSVYLGGTGSANALDDYEEGTWTPTYTTETSSFTSITLDSDNRGFYTKIGDVVFAQCFLRTDAITVGGASGDVYVDGFPFTVAVEDNTVHTAGGGIGLSRTFAGDVPTSYYCIRNDTKALLQYRTSANGDSSDLNVNDLATGTNSNLIIATFIYKAQ